MNAPRSVRSRWGRGGGGRRGEVGWRRLTKIGCGVGGGAWGAQLAACLAWPFGRPGPQMEPTCLLGVEAEAALERGDDHGNEPADHHGLKQHKAGNRGQEARRAAQPLQHSRKPLQAAAGQANTVRRLLARSLGLGLAVRHGRARRRRAALASLEQAHNVAALACGARPHGGARAVGEGEGKSYRGQ